MLLALINYWINIHISPIYMIVYINIRLIFQLLNKLYRFKEILVFSAFFELTIGDPDLQYNKKHISTRNKKGPSISIFLPLIIAILVGKQRYLMMYFRFAFPQWLYWALFHVLISLLSFVKYPIQIFCTVLIQLFVLSCKNSLY